MLPMAGSLPFPISTSEKSRSSVTSPIARKSPLGIKATIVLIGMIALFCWSQRIARPFHLLGQEDTGNDEDSATAIPLIMKAVDNPLDSYAPPY